MTSKQRAMLRSMANTIETILYVGKEGVTPGTVKEAYDRLDIPHLTEQQISLRFDRALGILDTLSVGAARTQQLRAYAESLMGRKK